MHHDHHAMSKSADKPAFPLGLAADGMRPDFVNEGMTFREHASLQILCAFIAKNGAMLYQQRVQQSVKIADALAGELEREPKTEDYDVAGTSVEHNASDEKR